MELTRQEKIDYLNVLIEHADIHINAVLKNIQAEPNYGEKGGKSREDIVQDFINKKAVYVQELDSLKQL